VQVAPERHVMVYTHHHILMDGWSSAQVMGEVMQRYHVRCRPRRHSRCVTTFAGCKPRTRPVPKPSGASSWPGCRRRTRLLDCLPGAQAGQGGMANVDRTLDVAQTQRLEAFARAQR
jgi:hypothetical protein